MGYAASAVTDGGLYAEVLVREGYDSMFTLNFTEGELVDLGVKKPHARRLVTAAQVVDDRANHRAHMRVRLRMVAPPMYVNTRNLSARYVAAYSKTWCMNEYSGMITDSKKLKFIPMLTVDLPFAALPGR